MKAYVVTITIFGVQYQSTLIPSSEVEHLVQALESSGASPTVAEVWVN